MSRAPFAPPSFRLLSPQNGTEYVIHVAMPEKAVEGGPWPAVAFLDGDDQFRFAAAAYRELRAKGEVPPLLLAGVGYGASYTKPGNRRIRDYTPTAIALEPESGGADGFMAFLKDTLWPELERRHPVADEVRGLAGHSLGSLLTLHALLRSAPAFNRILASAPSLWWDDHALIGRAAALERDGATVAARLFLGVGTDDTPSMTGDLERFEAQLAEHPVHGLEVFSRRFAGRNHYDVLPDAFREGLRTLFA
jgi:predicted alpha/beta superfamily hydrolase